MNTSSEPTLRRGSKEWRAEMLRLAAECDRLEIPEAAARLRMEEFRTPPIYDCGGYGCGHQPCICDPPEELHQ